MASRRTVAWYREQARKQYHRDGEIEIPDSAEISMSDDPTSSPGAYVQAWVWVDDEGDPHET